MASIKVKFKPSKIPGQDGAVYYQIVHRRVTRSIMSSVSIRQEEWDKRSSYIIAPVKSNRKPFIVEKRDNIHNDVERLARIVRRLESNMLEYSVDDIVLEYNRQLQEYSLTNYMEKMIMLLREIGKHRTAETYTSTLHSFINFMKGHDIMIDSITSELIIHFQSWLQGRRVVRNTISFYMRTLRSVYNRAVEEGISDNKNPFRHVYTGIDKTVKRALSVRNMNKIRSLDLSDSKWLEYSRDIFMLSFFLRGMSFIDMAFLRKSDLIDGRLVYRRRKSGSLLTIEWTREMQQIVDKYPVNESEYLIPIICSRTEDARASYLYKARKINFYLKDVAHRAGLSIPLTLYVARHTWASVAKSKGIPLGIISEGMGHNSEATTRIYLSSLAASVIDEANSLILDTIS